MPTTAKVSAEKNSGLQDDHDPSDIGQQTANRQQSPLEGPAAYAPHDKGEKKGMKPEAEAAYPDRDPAKKKTGEF
jgi:hypothetical protein